MIKSQTSSFLLPLIMFAVAFVILLLTIYPYYQKNNPAVTRPVPIPTVDIFKHTCPASGFIDCMPNGDNTGVRFECTPEAFNWYKANCPNFQGAAY